MIGSRDDDWLQAEHERVHRQRVLIGNGAFLLHQAAEHPAFDHGEHEVEPTADCDTYHRRVLRLRQVVIAARDLDETVDRLCAVLGLSVCFNDPSVAEFGLHNALLTVGDQFIEVVSPIIDHTAAARLLDRRQAMVTAYMVMFEVDDLDARMAALDGCRSAHRVERRSRHDPRPAPAPGRHRRCDRQPRRNQSARIVALGRAELDCPQRQLGRHRDRRLHDREPMTDRGRISLGAARVAPWRSIRRGHAERDRPGCHRSPQRRTGHHTRSGESALV